MKKNYLNKKKFKKKIGPIFNVGYDGVVPKMLKTISNDIFEEPKTKIAEIDRGFNLGPV